LYGLPTGNRLAGEPYGLTRDEIIPAVAATPAAVLAPSAQPHPPASDTHKAAAGAAQPEMGPGRPVAADLTLNPLHFGVTH
jgi:hypothetical protein